MIIGANGWSKVPRGFIVGRRRNDGQPGRRKCFPPLLVTMPLAHSYLSRTVFCLSLLASYSGFGFIEQLTDDLAGRW